MLAILASATLSSPSLRATPLLLASAALAFPSLRATPVFHRRKLVHLPPHSRSPASPSPKRGLERLCGSPPLLCKFGRQAARGGTRARQCSRAIRIRGRPLVLTGLRPLVFRLRPIVLTGCPRRPPLPRCQRTPSFLGPAATQQRQPLPASAASPINGCRGPGGAAASKSSSKTRPGPRQRRNEVDSVEMQRIWNYPICTSSLHQLGDRRLSSSWCM